MMLQKLKLEAAVNRSASVAVSPKSICPKKSSPKSTSPEPADLPKAITSIGSPAPGPAALVAPSTSKAKSGDRDTISPTLPENPSERFGPRARLGKTDTETV